MEVDNLFVAKHPELVSKLLKSYSTSEESREQLVDELLTADDPMNIDIKVDNQPSINMQTLNRYFEVLELAIENKLDEE